MVIYLRQTFALAKIIFWLEYSFICIAISEKPKGVNSGDFKVNLLLLDGSGC